MNPSLAKRWVRLCGRGALVAVCTGILFSIHAAPAMAQAAAQKLSPEAATERIATPPAPHSLQEVELIEYLNFTCPHCHSFLSAVQPMLQRYGKRVRLVSIPITFSGQNDLPVRLYYLAERQGQAERVKHLLFDAYHNQRVNIHDPQILDYLARSVGLGTEFSRDLQADWVTARVKAGEQMRRQHEVRFTPTLIVQRSYRMTPVHQMESFVEHLDKRIASLLLPTP